MKRIEFKYKTLKPGQRVLIDRIPIQIRFTPSETFTRVASRTLMKYYTGKEDHPLNVHFNQDSPHVQAERTMRRGAREFELEE